MIALTHIIVNKCRESYRSYRIVRINLQCNFRWAQKCVYFVSFKLSHLVTVQWTKQAVSSHISIKHINIRQRRLRNLQPTRLRANTWSFALCKSHGDWTDILTDTRTQVGAQNKYA
ncbi:hypothetical protein, unlikely [Trypanosoma brucei gambiense DAL972]|uniref:Uncharacterized protein n=1 Tax=Trypanosoma brucei gambiense (strain MHOM/CI/86/DAL972) TaxID=679716 RepID=C9ZV35_TRYB9|nr:hypothetical protein, unlikely [Trypanosoma brucei gambiense DAL972]CBH13273.1 hypothetical protein, unlikely [Trypanosoma brucei gambiense DAL972]|eukprot:XP_011775550.1 hypothetical protein, unlikely [Trypanosoma brucei gambiense DAL972]